MDKEPQTLEQELVLGGATASEARELAGLARQLPEVRQLPLLQTPAGLKHGHRMVRHRRTMRRWSLMGVLGGAMAAAVLVTVITTAAAQTAAPGEALYPVKRASEAVAVRVAPGFHDDMMMRRADEVNTLVERHKSNGLISATLASYNQAVTRDPAGSYAARDYCAGTLKAAAAKADPGTRSQIMHSLSQLKLDNT
jgi:hypothetical protein